MGSSVHLFALPVDREGALEQATGALWGSALDRYARPGLAEEYDGSLATVAATRGWRRIATVVQANLVALPGLDLRQYSLSSLFATHLVILLRFADDIRQIGEIRLRFGPALITAWDSFGHALGGEVDELDDAEPEELPIEDDPFRVSGDYEEPDRHHGQTVAPERFAVGLALASTDREHPAYGVLTA